MFDYRDCFNLNILAASVFLHLIISYDIKLLQINTSLYVNLKAPFLIRLSFG